MSYRDGVRQRDHKSPLDTMKCPTFPWEQHWVALSQKEETELLVPAQVVKHWIIVFILRNIERDEQTRKERKVKCLKKIDEGGT